MDSEASEKARRYRWLIFWTLAVGYFLVYFHRLCPSVVAVDMMKDLHASGGLLGLLGSAYFYPYALMQLPAGLLSDSWGPRRTITVFFVVACIGSIILGLAPSLWWAVFGRALAGLGVSMLFVPAMKVLAEWFEAREFASMTGILIAMGGVGSISAFRPLAWLSAAVNWRGAFIIVGIVTLVLALLVWLIVRDRPSDMGWPGPADRAPGAPAIGLQEGVRTVLSTPAFWPLALWFFFGCAVFFAFIGLWGGPYLMQVYGMSKGDAGNVLTMGAVGMIFGSPLLSLLSNRVFKGRKALLVIASAATLALTTILVLYTGRLSLTSLYLVCLGFGVFTNAIVVIGFTAAKELFPVSIAGTSTGLVNLFPFLGGAVFQPLLGHLLELSGKLESGAFTVTGYRNAFIALMLSAAVALAASIFIKETMCMAAAPGQDR
ncbi:MAG TPA: MFS transporter [bacterium]|nr:MFS transporter [bacterium]